MGAATRVTWTEHTADELLKLTRDCRDAKQAARARAVAMIMEGASRTEAARAQGMDLQILRDWVLRYDAEGFDGLADRPRGGSEASVMGRSTSSTILNIRPSRPGLSFASSNVCGGLHTFGHESRSQGGRTGFGSRLLDFHPLPALRKKHDPRSVRRQAPASVRGRRVGRQRHVFRNGALPVKHNLQHGIAGLGFRSRASAPVTGCKPLGTLFRISSGGNYVLDRTRSVAMVSGAGCAAFCPTVCGLCRIKARATASGVAPA